MNILFFGIHYWDSPWFRKQQFAKRFAERGHKVFYVEDSDSIIRRKKGDRNLPLRSTIRKENENLFVITPSALFPYPLNYFSRSLYNLKILNDCKRFLKKLGINEFMFWFTRPEHGTFLKGMNQIKIFDICDDIPGYSLLSGNMKRYKKHLFYLKNSLKHTDIAVVSAAKIKEKYQSLTQNEMIVIPNGHSINLNDEAKINLPSDIADIPKPRVGFIGSLFQFIDEDLLEFIISRRPQYNFVFVGGIEGYFPIDRIKKYPNTYLLGRKPQKEIPNYISAFDVCINPFKIHEVNDSVNPVKVYEYLAKKKVVVSVKMYSLMKENISKYVLFAENYDDFLKKLDSSLMDSKNNNIPDTVLQQYHWDNIFERLVIEIKDKHSLVL
jgi:hypothetical protein